MSDDMAEKATQPDTPDKFKRLKLSAIDWTHRDGDDSHFMFRLTPRPMGLKQSISDIGQQVPIIVRPHPSPPSKKQKYQLICGFRRCKALHELEGDDAFVSANIREVDDDGAIKLSFMENCERKSYTAVEKANAVATVLRRKGLSDSAEDQEAAVQMLGIGKRQTRNFLRLLKMEPSVRMEVDADSHFQMTHALEMYRVLGKYAGVQVPIKEDPNPEKHRRLIREWMDYINAETLGVKAIKELEEKLEDADRIAASSAAGTRGLIARSDKDGKTLIKFNIRKLVVEELSDEDCRQIRGHLRQLLDLIPQR